ncbi:hypothetical protein F1C10_02685 [Sphingomonas sp. NBWT7]|uniref:hypothetical protein n=1 Tax=Sphingomonas sp. NBWT7 TaxID=2596913 RepID=UPI001623D4C0|nr:hypothetical protein [Sphingomonas sp. NBWT7]QNE30968.1 hypothetical protein F1C10_02685 [Sphingomonas sp. NBWT7]
MAGWMMLALQVIAGPPAPVPPRRATERSCPVAQPGEDIVVCAPPNDTYRLKPLPGRFAADRTPPKAETTIAGVGRVAAEVEQGADAQGGVINRAMIRLRIPLGRSKP